MKLKIIFPFILFIISLECSAQNIYSALQHDKGLDLREEPKVNEVFVRKTFYNKESTNTQKDIIIVNSKHKIVSETRFNNDGELESRLTRTFDSTGQRSLTRKLERWHPVMGYGLETAHYSYDENGHLINIQDKNQNDIVYQETTLINNEKGDPIDLTIRTRESKPVGKEIAIYDYPNNSAVTKVLGNDGKVISESSITIDFSFQMKDNVYNDFGDIIKSDKYEYEYKYDKQKNWVTKTIFKIVDGKRKKYQVIKRKIKYSE